MIHWTAYSIIIGAKFPSSWKPDRLPSSWGRGCCWRWVVRVGALGRHLPLWPQIHTHAHTHVYTLSLSLSFSLSLSPHRSLVWEGGKQETWGNQNCWETICFSKLSEMELGRPPPLQEKSLDDSAAHVVALDIRPLLPFLRCSRDPICRLHGASQLVARFKII